MRERKDGNGKRSAKIIFILALNTRANVCPLPARQRHTEFLFFYLKKVKFNKFIEVYVSTQSA